MLRVSVLAVTVVLLAAVATAQVGTITIVKDADPPDGTDFDFAIPATFLLVWGSQGSGDGQFNHPNGVAVDNSGNVYVADSENHRIQKFDRSGNYLGGWGSQGSGDGQFNYAHSLTVDSSGNVYVADMFNYRVQKFDGNGTYLAQWGSQGSGDGQFDRPKGIAVDNSGHVYVADMLNHRIQKFDSGGTYLAQWGSSGSGDGQFNNPAGVAVDSSGNAYVADTSNHRIQKFDSNGTYLAQWGSLGSGDGQFLSRTGVAVSSSGYVYVADYSNHRIQEFDSSGYYLLQWGSSGSGDGQFNYPAGVAVDSSGNAYVADTSNHRIQKFFALGNFTLDDADPDDTDGIADSITFSDLSPADYDITELVPAGWNLDSVDCVGGSSTPITDGVTVHLQASEDVTCTFTNAQPGACCAADGTCTVETEVDCLAAGGTWQGAGTTCTPNPCLATIIVEKQTDPDGWPDAFTINVSGSGGFNQDVLLSDDEQIVLNVPPGDYTVQEDAPYGWDPSADHTCPPGATCNNFTTCIEISAEGFCVRLRATAYVQNLAAGQTFTIILTNSMILEFGDAPDSYGTLLASDGARHLWTYPVRLGTTSDLDSDGQPTPGADGDDSDAYDDEDGVAFPNPLVAGTAVNISVDGGPSGGKLDAWIDFNADGAFDHPDEQIAASLDVAAGANSVAVTIPAGAVVGQTYARFRMSTAGGLSPTGFAEDGEVEDYQVQIEPPLATGACCAADGTCTVVTEADCTAAGGDWHGAGTTCDPNPCPSVVFTPLSYPEPYVQMTIASDIHTGTIVGYYDIGSLFHGFVKEGDNWTSHDHPDGIFTLFSGVEVVGADTHIVGKYLDSNFKGHAFLYDGTNWTELIPDVPNVASASAMGISGGRIVGSYDIAGGGGHGYLYDPAQPAGQQWTTLDYPGANETLARDIDGDHVVGHYDDGSTNHGFHVDLSAQPPAWLALDYPGVDVTKTEAFGIDGDHVVGWYMVGTGGAGNVHGFLYDRSTQQWTQVDHPGAATTRVYGIYGGKMVGDYTTRGEDGFLAEFTSACCFADPPYCEILTEDECFAAGGTWSDAYVACGIDCNANGISDSCEIVDGLVDDCDGNWIPDDCELCGDLDNDYDVDYDDYVIFLDAFGGPVDGFPIEDACCDYDATGAVGMGDFDAWLTCYRTFIGRPSAPPPSPPGPEITPMKKASSARVEQPLPKP